MRSTAIVLVGSGRSLNHVDVRRLARYATITFNRAYIAWPEWGFVPSYHACLDPLSVAVIGAGLREAVAGAPGTHFFFHSHATQFGVEENNRVTLCELAPGEAFALSLSRLTDLGNVGAMSLQILALLGFTNVLMVGVDGYYSFDGDTRTRANHFRDDYAAGRKTLTPADHVRYIAGWSAAATECRRLGMDVRNASPGTALTCFEAIAFDDGLAWLDSAAAQ